MAFKMRWLIEGKLSEVNALTIDTAVTADEAGLSFSEVNWLLYLTGGMASKIRKTPGGLYFLRGTK